MKSDYIFVVRDRRQGNLLSPHREQVHIYLHLVADVQRYVVIIRLQQILDFGRRDRQFAPLPTQRFSGK